MGRACVKKTSSANAAVTVSGSLQTTATESQANRLCALEGARLANPEDSTERDALQTWVWDPNTGYQSGVRYRFT